MNKPIATLAVLGACAAIPSSVSASPSWCHNMSGHCATAEDGVTATLGERVGDDWFEARNAILSCPSADVYGGVAYCMAYFSHAGRYYFVSASVSQAQASRVDAKIDGITRWHRYWRNCSMAARGFKTPPGRLEANQPCDSLPLEATYTVGNEMSGWTGRVGYTHRVGWIFTGSAYFVEAGMKAVALDTCGYKHRTITCSDREGNSLRYAY